MNRKSSSHFMKSNTVQNSALNFLSIGLCWFESDEKRRGGKGDSPHWQRSLLSYSALLFLAIRGVRSTRCFQRDQIGKSSDCDRPRRQVHPLMCQYQSMDFNKRLILRCNITTYYIDWISENLTSLRSNRGYRSLRIQRPGSTHFSLRS